MKEFRCLYLICALLLCALFGCGPDANPSFFLDMMKDPADANPVVQCLTEPPIDEGETFSIRFNKQCLTDLSTTPSEQLPLPIEQSPLPEHDDIPINLIPPSIIERKEGFPDWMLAQTAVSIPQQHIDRQSGIMWVGHGFPPHENGTIFPRKVSKVFLTAEAVLRSEQYQMLKSYFAEWNSEYDKIAHTTDEWLFPGHSDFDGNSVYVHFNIATKEEVHKFLTSAVESCEFHERSRITKHIVGTDGIVHLEHLFPNSTLFALALSEWEHLIFSADPPNSITWFQVRVFAKNTEELGSDEEYEYLLNLTE